jgi:nucleotide-binding universal stress UspA family protein
VYKHMLVPLDGSKLAESALPHAESLALKYGADIHLLRVARLPSLTGREFDGPEQFQLEMDLQKDEAERYLKGLLGEFREKGISVATHVGYGPVVAEIIDAADRYNADLVIIASHGRTGLSKVFFGSVASGVLNRIERPLMIIRSSG